jgi:hypothetical protein
MNYITNLFLEEKFTLMDTEKLCPKKFFNESLGLAFIGASPKFNFVSCWVIYNVQDPHPPIETGVTY